MSESEVVKVLTRGSRQFVRLPRAVRIVGDRVRVRRVDAGILIEPVITDADEWFRALDRFSAIPFMEEGRQQPPMPPPHSLE